jgi:hypothetical protein
MAETIYKTFCSCRLYAPIAKSKIQGGVGSGPATPQAFSLRSSSIPCYVRSAGELFCVEPWASAGVCKAARRGRKALCPSL